MKTVTLKEANQQFARLVKLVEAGDSLMITRRGKVIAKLVPANDLADRDAEWWAAFERTRERLTQGYAGGEPWRGRDELYDRD